MGHDLSQRLQAAVAYIASERKIELRGRLRDEDARSAAASRARKLYAADWTSRAALRTNMDVLAAAYLEHIINPERNGAVLVQLWRRCDARAPQHVLDAGCGIGLDVCFLAKQFPAVEFVGSDISKDMLRQAMKRAQRMQLDNVQFVNAAHDELPERVAGHPFDCIIANGSLHRLVCDDLVRHFEGLRCVLSGSGEIIVVESAAGDPQHVALHAMDAELLPIDGTLRRLEHDGERVCWMGSFQHRAAPGATLTAVG